MTIEESSEKYFASQAVIDLIGESINRLEGKTIFCTGTGGFLGKWVVNLIAHVNRTVFNKPCRLIACDLRLPGSNYLNRFAGSQIEFIAHDLCQPLWPLAEKVDYVLHLAGIASPHHYKERPLETIDVAINGARSALEIAKHSGARYLFTSSSEVYQTPSLVPTPEYYVGAIASNNDRSCYDVSKLMAENLGYVYYKAFGVNTGAVRIFNSFGPGLPETDYRILPRLGSAVVGGHRVKVFSNKQMPTRTYCPVQNTLAGLILALVNGAPSEIYNIGLDKPEISVIELIEMINSCCNLNIQYDLVQPPDVYQHEPLRRCPDISKAKSEIGYDPSFSLEMGLKRFIQWSIDEYSGAPGPQ